MAAFGLMRRSLSFLSGQGVAQEGRKDALIIQERPDRIYG
jgi:hypothetical protein